MAQAALLNTRGDLLARSGRADESLIEIGHSLAAYRAMPLPRRKADVLTNLAETYLKLGRFAAAIQHSASAKNIINEYQRKGHERKLHRLFATTREKIDAPLLLLRIPQINVHLRRHFFLKSERGERGQRFQCPRQSCLAAESKLVAAVQTRKFGALPFLPLRF